MGVAVGVMRVLDVPYRGNLDVDNGSPFERDNTADRRPVHLPR